MDNNTIGFQSCICMKNKIIFPAFEGNGLFSFDGIELSFLGQLDNEDKNYSAKMFGTVCNYENNIILTPLRAKYIEVFDLKKNISKSVTLPNELQNCTAKFFTSVRYEDSLFIFPILSGVILKYNLNDETIEQVVDLKTQINEEDCNGDVMCGYGYVQRGKKLYLPLCCISAVLEFDLENYSTKVTMLQGLGYSAICDDGKSIWLMPRRKNAPIVSWNPETKEKREFSNYPENYVFGGFLECFYYENYVYGITECGNMPIKIDVVTGQISAIKGLDLICNEKFAELDVRKENFIYAKKMKDKVLLCTGKHAELVLYDLKSQEVVYRKVLVASLECKEAFGDIFREKQAQLQTMKKRMMKNVLLKGLIRESELHRLDVFIEVLKE